MHMKILMCVLCLLLNCVEDDTVTVSGLCSFLRCQELVINSKNLRRLVKEFNCSC